MPDIARSTTGVGPGGEKCMNIREKVCVVVGAASGMGRLAARRCASAGATVAALDIDEDGLRETAAGFESIRTWRVDVTHRAEVDAVVKSVEAELGPFERVYNSAAIMPTGLLVDWNITDRLHEIAVPTLVMAASHDTMEPAFKRMMSERMQQARYVEMPNGGHFAQWDDTEYYFPALIDFIQDVDAGRSIAE